jgi:poly(3-hydroxybutyrate) depolymerase
VPGVRVPLLLAPLLLVLIASAGASAAAERLPALGADAGAVTVSGVSSGAYMAVQLHVAHSATVRGAAAIAGGPYGCAGGSLWTALTSCMDPGPWSALPQPQRLVDAAQALAKSGAIDPLERLAGAKVWLFSGTRDETVSAEIVETLRRFYLAAAPGADVALENSVPAGHGMVTESAGNECSTTQPPFIVDCDYDAAGILLRHLLGPLRPPNPKEDGKMLSFDQREFAGGAPAAISLADAGHVFVPDACARERCRVHVALHGCRQSAEQIGERFVLEAGYNRWAAANRLIVLYPQTIPRYGFSFGARNFVLNPKACWDWWGYTGEAYATKQGPQIRAVAAMLERLGKPR